MEIRMNTDEPISVAKPFQCTICPKTFVYESSLKEHILNKHVAEKKFKCAQCFETKQITKSFATQNILTKHIKRVHGPPRFKCQVCFKTCVDSSNFASHKRSHFQEPSHKCHLCSKAFRSNQALKIHLFNVHKQRRENVFYLNCEICSREFVTPSALELHVVRQHVVDKAFECSVCSKKFIDQQSLEKHMKRHDKQNTNFCDICSQGFTQRKSLVDHLGVKHNYFFYCDKCSRSFRNKPDFDEHLSDSEQELKCSICQELINSKCNFKIHTDSHVKKIKTKTKNNEIKNQIKHLETDTKFTPISTKQLNSENFECELCSKTFDREAYFKAHRNQVHLNVEWICNFQGCSKTFKLYNRLRLHKMMHAETMEYVCNTCGKPFYRPDSLKLHEKLHLKERKYKCEICPKSFPSPSKLRTHIANNHGGVKPFKCPVVNCGTFWATNSQLNAHLISHQTEKTFNCQLCTTLKAFKTLGQLKYHQLKVHLVPKGIKPLKSQKNVKNRKHSDAFFVCYQDACFFKTDDGKDMALHYNEQHQLPKVVIFRC